MTKYTEGTWRGDCKEVDRVAAGNQEREVSPKSIEGMSITYNDTL